MVQIISAPNQQYTQKMLGCFNPSLGQIWTNQNVGLKCNKWLGLSIFDPKLG